MTFISDKNPVKKDFLAYTQFSVAFFVIGALIFIYAWTGHGGSGESGLVFIVVASQAIMVLSFLVLLFSLVGAKKSFDTIKRENHNRTARTCLYINLSCLICIILLCLSIFGLYWFSENKRSNSFSKRPTVVAPESHNAAPVESRPLPQQPIEIYTSIQPLKALPPAPRKEGAEPSPGTSRLWQPKPLKSRSGDSQK